MAEFTARSLAEIEAAMLADKASRAPLDGITTTSDASVFRQLIRCIATAVNLHENAFTSLVNEVEALAARLQVGTPRWYAAESLLFQWGDTLIFDQGQVTYAVIDPEKQIVKLAAADTENGFLVLKVAALTPEGTARALTASELGGFIAYWSKKKFACTPLDFISQQGDIARIAYRIGVDVTVINPSDGTLLADPLRRPVEDAIVTFLRTYQGRRFNSVFRIAELTDVIQKVDGVINPIPVSVQIKPFNGTFTDVIADVNDEYLSRSGFIVPDTAPDFTLQELLTYYNAS